LNNNIASLNNAREEGREEKASRFVFIDVHQRLLREVAENYDRLDGCMGHHFVPLLDDCFNTSNGFGCDRCGGIVTVVEKKLYDQGLKHGRL
jgi:hypothetical protein